MTGGGSYDAVMPTWRCPHCGTPQSEAARCWVCHRSTTSCATCRNFRRSVAQGVGYCGLDSRRVPLHGDEQRACWVTGSPVTLHARPASTAALAEAAAGSGPRALWDDPEP